MVNYFFLILSLSLIVPYIIVLKLILSFIIETVIFNHNIAKKKLRLQNDFRVILNHEHFYF